MGIAAAIGTSGAALMAGTGLAITAAGTAYAMTQGGGSSGGGQVQETAQGRKAADIAAEQYNTYMSEVKPTEEKFIADVMQPTGLHEAQQAGKVNADMAQRASGYFTNNTPQNLTRTLSDLSKTATTLATAETAAKLGVQDKKIAGLQAITDIGEGKRSAAQLGLNSVAADAQKNAQAQAQANQDRQGAIIKGAGSLVGAVGGLAKNWDSGNPYNKEWDTFDYNQPTDYSVPAADTFFVPDSPSGGY